MTNVMAAVLRSKIEFLPEEEGKLAQVMDEIWPDYAIRALLKTAGWKEVKSDGRC